MVLGCAGACGLGLCVTDFETIIIFKITKGIHISTKDFMQSIKHMTSNQQSTDSVNYNFG